MAAERTLYAKEDPRLRNKTGKGVDIPFLVLLLLLLGVGLVMHRVSLIQDTRFLPSIYKNKACAPVLGCCVCGLSAGSLLSSG